MRKRRQRLCHLYYGSFPCRAKDFLKSSELLAGLICSHMEYRTTSNELTRCLTRLSKIQPSLRSMLHHLRRGIEPWVRITCRFSPVGDRYLLNLHMECGECCRGSFVAYDTLRFRYTRHGLVKLICVYSKTAIRHMVHLLMYMYSMIDARWPKTKTNRGPRLCATLLRLDQLSETRHDSYLPYDPLL